MTPSPSRLSTEIRFRPVPSELENFVKGDFLCSPESPDEAELVILTGGNSEWFWIRIVMLEPIPFGDVDLRTSAVTLTSDSYEQPGRRFPEGWSMIRIRVIVSAQQTARTNKSAYTTATDKAADRTVLAQENAAKYAVWTLYENGEFHMMVWVILKDSRAKKSIY